MVLDGWSRGVLPLHGLLVVLPYMHAAHRGTWQDASPLGRTPRLASALILDGDAWPRHRCQSRKSALVPSTGGDPRWSLVVTGGWHIPLSDLPLKDVIVKGRGSLRVFKPHAGTLVTCVTLEATQ